MYKRKMKLCFLFIAFCFLYSIHRTYSSEIVPYHTFEILSQCAGFTPDGKYVVIPGYTGSSPGSSNGVLFYDIEDSNLLKVLPAARYSDFQISPDGTMLIGGEASGPYEAGADLWDLTSNRLIHTFTPFNFYEQYGDIHVAISPDKQYILTDKIPAGFCTPTLWSKKTSQGIHSFEEYFFMSSSSYNSDLESQFAYIDHGGVSLAFSPDGESVLIDDNIYSMPACKYERSLDLQNVVYDTVFSPDGSLLIVSDRSETLNGRERIVIWDWKTKSKIDTLYESMETGAPYAAYVDISPDNRLLASGMRNGELWIWDISKKEILVRMKVKRGNDPKDNLPNPKFSPDGKYILSTGEITKKNWTYWCVYLWRMSDILQTSSVDHYKGYGD